MNGREVIESISEELRPRFSDCYIFLMAGHALTIKRDAVQEPSNHRRLLETADTLIDVIEGVFYVAKSRNPYDRDLLLHAITNDQVIELETDPVSWAHLKWHMMQHDRFPLADPQLLRTINGKAHWLEQASEG